MENRITSTTEIETLQTETTLTLDELVQRGAKRMLEAALAAEVEAYIQRHQSERDAAGHALVVRNGKSRERPLHTGAGILKIAAPRVNDKREEHKSTSAILPPYMRRTPRLEEAVPVLYLRGLSTGDFQEALSALLGEEAVSGFSATTVTRLLAVWHGCRVARRTASVAETAVNRERTRLHLGRRYPFQYYQTALDELARFTRTFEDKYPKAVETLTKDQDKMPLPLSEAKTNKRQSLSGR